MRLEERNPPNENHPVDTLADVGLLSADLENIRVLVRTPHRAEIEARYMQSSAIEDVSSAQRSVPNPLALDAEESRLRVRRGVAGLGSAGQTARSQDSDLP